MSARNQTIYLKTLVWNALTWDAGEEGTIALSYRHESTPVESRAGNDGYSRQILMANKRLIAIVTLKNVKQTHALGAASSNLVGTVAGKADVAINCATMRLFAVNGNQPHEVDGDCQLSFIHESADGQANPLS